MDMQLKEIILNKGKSRLSVFFYTDYDPKDFKGIDNLLDVFLNSIYFNKQIGYAGFSSKKSLRAQLKFLIFGKNSHKIQLKQLSKFPFRKAEILSKIANIFKKCLGQLPVKSTWIFIFPTFDQFIKNKTGGIGAFVPWQHTILLTLHPESKRWRKTLPNTLTHEFNHSVRFHYFPLSPNNTLLDILISEGLADNFTYQITKKLNPWVITLSFRECKKIFSKIKKLLNSKSKKVYRSLFFEDKKYPLWAGYAVGYQIIRSFLKNNKNLKWEEVIKLRSKEILKRPNWLKNDLLEK